MPIALAASVVVTFSVVMLVRQERGALPKQAATTMKSEAVAPASPPAPATGNLAADAQTRDDRPTPAEAPPRAKAERKNEATERRALAPVESAAPPAATSILQEQRMPPEAWLDRIRSLRDRERVEDARVELEAFRRANPDYAIPDDLRKLLPPP